MRKLRKAAVVAVMVGSVGMFGAGTASAYGSEGHQESKKDYGHHESKKDYGHEDSKKDYGHEESKKKEVVDLPDFVVNNPQFMDCSYTGNTSTALTQAATAGTGDASNSATLGNVCVQTGPTFTQGDDA